MSEKMFDIIGMGAALLDILAQVPEETLAAHKIPKGNMALVESTQLQELCAHFPKAKRASGGATANTLVAASAQGATAGFIGAVGADEQGWHYVR